MAKYLSAKEGVVEYVQRINELSKKYRQSNKYMEIRSRTCDLTKKEYHFLVEIDANNKIKQPFLEGNVKERLFRWVLDAVFDEETENFWISRLDCLEKGVKISPTMFPKDLVEKYIMNMIEHGYFAVSLPNPQKGPEEKLTLGVRTLVECADTLESRYGERVKYCQRCYSIILHGLECTQCHYRYHAGCKKIAPVEITNCPNCTFDKVVPVKYGYSKSQI